jgi:hypothetical protein
LEVAKLIRVIIAIISTLFLARQGVATSNVGMEARKITFHVTIDARIDLVCDKGNCALFTSIGGEDHIYQHNVLFGQDAVRPYFMEVFSGINGFNKNHFVVQVPVDCRADGEMGCSRSVLIRRGKIFSSDYIVSSHK